MPHTASAAKRLRKSETRRKHNRTIAKAIKLKRRELGEALTSKDVAKSGEQPKIVVQSLDRAASKGYIHKNKAARLKSRLAKKLKSLSK